MAIKSVRDIKDLAEKNVLARVDFDVPINKSGQVEDITRIEKCLPTIKYLLDKKAKVTLLTKIGRPGEGKKTSTKILLPILEKLLGTKVEWCQNPLDPNLPSLLKNSSCKVFLMENIRFHKEEEAPDKNFAKELSKPFDIYVNEAFAMCHRKDASISILPTLLPSYAGFRLIEEYKTLTNLLKNPQRPFVAIIGGSKVETKLPVIENLAKIANKVLVGGKISLELSLALPSVLNAVDNLDKKDIGPKSIELFKMEISKAKTIVWSGPMGIFETPPYNHGTNEIAQAVAKSGAYKVIGGGDTISAISKAGVLDKMDFVSTGGGAMLTLLSGKPMPGILALEKSGRNIFPFYL